jgi:Flp pilus assembly protein TadD
VHARLESRNARIVTTALLLAAIAADVGAQNAAISSDRREQLTEISQRLANGDTTAIDALLACTKPVAADAAPSSADIERLRAEVERLREAEHDRGVVTLANEPSSVAPQKNAQSIVREARAWLRAGEPAKCLKTLGSAASSSTIDAEASYWRACALEELGRDDEALDQFRRAAQHASSPAMKLAAASGVDHLEWRTHRARGAAQAKP